MAIPTRSPNQTESAYLRLRDELLTCRIRPGQKLNINDLTTHLQVNLGAVREALSRLTSEGLVTSESHRGFRAAPVSLSDLLDLTRTRIRIETLCLESAIACGDVEWEVRIVASYHRLSRAHEFEKDGSSLISEAWSAAYSDFHAALVAACELKWLLKLQTLLQAQFERYLRISIPVLASDDTLYQNYRTEQNQDHKLLMEAAISHDAATAGRVIENHLEQASDFIKIFLQANDFSNSATAKTPSTAGPPDVQRKSLSQKPSPKKSSSKKGK